MASTSTASGAPLIVLFVLVGAALGILVAGHWRVHWRLSAWVALAAIVIAPALAVIAVLSGQSGATRGMIELEGHTSVQVFLASGAAAGFLLLDLGTRHSPRSARYALLLFATCGIVTVAQSRHLIPLVLGVATLHVALSALTSIRPRWASYALSAAGLAAVLLAAALLYGATGSLQLDQVRDRLVEQTAQGLQNPLALLALALLLAGLGLHLGVMPFHTWVHAVLTRARAQEGYLVTALGPQLALAVLAHLSTAWPAKATELALLIASASILYGHARALRASSLPSLIAGLVTGQTGLLLGHAFLARTTGQAMPYYSLGSYLLNVMCLWAISSQLPHAPGRPHRVVTFAGLSRRAPWLGAALMVCTLNVAGLYPLAGAFVQIEFLRKIISAGHSSSAVIAIGGNILAWLVVGKLALQARGSHVGEAVQGTPSPEVTVVAWGAVGAMFLSGLYAEGLWRWVSALAGGT